MTGASIGKKCLKCGYIRKESDFAPEYSCPACGAVYKKVEAAKNRESNKGESIDKKRKEITSPSNINLWYFSAIYLAASFIISGLFWYLSYRGTAIILLFVALWVFYSFVFARKFKKIYEYLLVGLLGSLCSVFAIISLGANIEEYLNKSAARNAGFSSVTEYEAAQRKGFHTQEEYARYLREHAKKEAERKKVEQERREQEKLAGQERRKREEEKCKRDLQCWGGKKSVSAGLLCRSYVEQLAKYDYEWTDGWLERKFSRFRWKDKNRRIITFIGDKVKFQNPFGAWQRHTYECDLDTENDRVLSVRAKPGRL